VKLVIKCWYCSSTVIFIATFFPVASRETLSTCPTAMPLKLIGLPGLTTFPCSDCNVSCSPFEDKCFAGGKSVTIKSLAFSPSPTLTLMYAPPNKASVSVIPDSDKSALTRQN
jgi:hypothetical protein